MAQVQEAADPYLVSLAHKVQVLNFDRMSDEAVGEFYTEYSKFTMGSLYTHTPAQGRSQAIREMKV